MDTTLLLHYQQYSGEYVTKSNYSPYSKYCKWTDPVLVTFNIEAAWEILQYWK